MLSAQKNSKSLNLSKIHDVIERFKFFFHFFVRFINKNVKSNFEIHILCQLGDINYLIFVTSQF